MNQDGSFVVEDRPTNRLYLILQVGRKLTLKGPETSTSCFGMMMGTAFCNRELATPGDDVDVPESLNGRAFWNDQKECEGQLSLVQTKLRWMGYRCFGRKDSMLLLRDSAVGQHWIYYSILGFRTAATNYDRKCLRGETFNNSG